MHLIAQVVPELNGIVGALLGLIGSIIGWLLVRFEKRQTSLEKSVDRLAKSILLQMVGMGMLNSTVRTQAQDLLDEVTAKEKKEDDS